MMSGLKMGADEDIEKILNKFLDHGTALAIITLGDKGCIYATKDDRKMKRISTEKVKAVDTTVSNFSCKMKCIFD